MDRLDAMKVLLAVVDEGSLSAGSRKLNAPLPSVSRKVAELERHLGTRLLIRTSRNIQLTDAGRDYVDAARAIVAQILEAEQRASGEYEVPRGELTVTALIGFSRIIAIPLAAEFLRQHPEITLNFLALDRPVNLVDEHVDVAIRAGNLTDNSLYAVKVGEIDMVTAASPEYLERKGRPKRPEDLADHDGVSYEVVRSQWIFSGSDENVEARPNIRVRANTASGAVAAAVEGLGITRLPTYQMAGQLQSGELVPILCQWDRRKIPVHLVYARQGLLPLKVRAFLDWMTPRLRQRLKELEALSRQPPMLSEECAGTREAVSQNP
ncbi:MAG TPA: LysR family transcriptional regulator [Sphingomicrobium sp.]|nr:LysR family transcriptional regulator [Sphingomicrobium sp.]